MADPMFSVVIPCYNCAGTIRETLESIFAQAETSFEVIAVDDGSSDESAAIIQAYGSGIRYIYQDNAGVSAARNTGVRHASGEWIAFCDADDLWVPHKLSLMRSAIEAIGDACDLVFSDFAVSYGDQVVEPNAMISKHSFFPVFREFGLTIKELFEKHTQLEIGLRDGTTRVVNLRSGNIFKWLILGNIVLPSTVVVKKSAFDQVGGFRREFRNAEDTEFFLRFSRQSDYSYVNDSLATYRRASNSLLSTSMLRTILNGIRAVEINCRDKPEVYRVYRQIVDRSLARKYAKLAYFYLSELEPQSAFRTACVSLGYRRSELLAWKVLVGSMVPRRIMSFARRGRALAKRWIAE